MFILRERSQKKCIYIVVYKTVLYLFSFCIEPVKDCHFPCYLVSFFLLNYYWDYSSFILQKYHIENLSKFFFYNIIKKNIYDLNK